jgi:hypothetical protein
MANEFIIKNGFRSQGDSEITGSLSVSGPISTTSPVNLSGFATGSVLFTSGSEGAITGSSNLFWDNTNGRLGVGTSTPENPLVVRGPSTRGIELINILNSKSWRVNINSNDFFITETGVGNPFVIQAGGNVGIGTISPTSRLQVKGSGATSATTALLVENTNASASLVVLDNGNVGIGTSTPLAKLQVQATSSTETTQRWTDDAGNLLGDFAEIGDAGVLRVGYAINNAIPARPLVTINGGSGNSSAAVTLRSKTGVSNIVLGSDTTSCISGSNLALGYIPGSAPAVLNISGSISDTLLKIDSSASSSILFVSGSGRVGIGTSTPRTTTEVVGTLRITNISNSSRFNDLATDLNGYVTLQNLTYSGGIGSNSGYVNLFPNFINVGSLSGYFFTSVENSGGSTRDAGFSRAGISLISVNSGSIGNANGSLVALNLGAGIGTSSPSSRLQVRGSGATSATTTFLLQNSSPTNLMTVLDNGQTTFSSPIVALATSQSAFTISQSISASNTVGGQYYGVNITPTFFATTTSQTETALRVAATFTGSAAAIGGQNIIADFGATSAGSQFTVTDVTSGSIYMVNDVSGLPIIEATSDWTVNMYNYPNLVFNKTGSQVNIFGTLRVSGSFILPLSQSAAPQTGSAYWSGSFLFIYDGTQYRSSSFA